MVALFLFPIFPLNFTNIIFTAFSTLSIVFGILSYKFINWKLVLLPYIIAIPFIPYSIEYLTDPNNALLQIEFLKKIQFLFAPLSFGMFFSMSKFRNQNYLINSFTISTIIISLYTFLVLLIHNEVFNSENYLNGAYLIRQKFESISHLHPTYFGLFSAISIFWLLYNLFSVNNKFRWLNIISLIILILMEVLIAAKAPFFIIIFGCMWLIYKKAASLKRFLLVSTFIVCSALLFVLFSPSLKNRMNEVQTFFMSENLQDNTINQRKLIISCNVELFKEHFWFGTGVANSQKLLDQCYTCKQNNVHQSVQYNSHNQYFTMGINYGVGVLLLFLFSILWILKKAKGNDFYLISFLSIILIMLSESIRQDGNG